MDKIGITEAGEVAFNLEVFDRLFDGNIIITKRLSDKVIEKLVEQQDKIILHLGCTGFGGSQVEPLVSFIKKSKKGVQLSYIKNFARNIPENVIEIKKKVDELYIFDNYCVLYYDPQKKAYLQTSEEQEKERQRKADPILFGMIFGSRKLYYIADWVDEFCDLTLEEFLKVSGLTEKDIEIPKTIEI